MNVHVQWRIKRYRQPYRALCAALEYLCEWTGHINGCALLNRHGGIISAPYQWSAFREVEWERFDQPMNTAA